MLAKITRSTIAIYLVVFCSTAIAEQITNKQWMALTNEAYPHNKFWKKALRTLESDAIKGNKIAQYRLGRYYLQRAYFSKQDKTKYYNNGLYWLKKAADQGLAEAENRLGVCYQNGQGVPKSYTKAYYWYKKAATQGNGDADENIGRMYYRGEGGLPQNTEKANFWFEKAVRNGDSFAKVEIDQISTQKKLDTLNNKFYPLQYTGNSPAKHLFIHELNKTHSYREAQSICYQKTHGDPTCMEMIGPAMAAENRIRTRKIVEAEHPNLPEWEKRQVFHHSIRNQIEQQEELDWELQHSQ